MKYISLSELSHAMHELDLSGQAYWLTGLCCEGEYYPVADVLSHSRNFLRFKPSEHAGFHEINGTEFESANLEEG